MLIPLFRYSIFRVLLLPEDLQGTSQLETQASDYDSTDLEYDSSIN